MPNDMKKKKIAPKTKYTTNLHNLFSFFLAHIFSVRFKLGRYVRTYHIERINYSNDKTLQ